MSRVDGPLPVVSRSVLGYVWVVMGHYQEVAKENNLFPLLEAIIQGLCDGLAS